MPTRWVPSLRSTLLLNQVPIWVFSVGILLITGIVLGTVSAWEGELAAEVASGTLSVAKIGAIAGFMRVIWIASLAGFLLFAAGGTWVALKNHRALAARLDRIAVFAEGRCHGEDLADLDVLADDAIGRLERAVTETANLAETRSEELHSELGRQRFAAQLQTALELADSERDVYDLTRHALTKALPERSVEMLLADNSQAHLRQAVSASLEARGCPVESPASCAAVRRGQTLRFEDSDALDACPRLRDQGRERRSAVCTPVGVMGRTIGVVHAIGEAGVLPTDTEVGKLETLATFVGGRLGMVRTLSSSRLQARTDTLTGMLNRRAFEEDALSILRRPGSHAVVMIDLDYFKKLNDRHGHAAGDRALKVFSEVLTGAVRDGDVVGRHGGEEFVACLADCDVVGAEEVLERVRRDLRAALERTGMPRFTVSCGASMTPRDGEELEELLRAADKALYDAKRSGRDRVIFFGPANEDLPGCSMTAEVA